MQCRVSEHYIFESAPYDFAAADDPLLTFHLSAMAAGHLPGDGIKRDPERENRAVLAIAAQTANSIHIWVTFNAITRYISQLAGS